MADDKLVKEILIQYQDFLKKDDFEGFYKALNEIPSPTPSPHILHATGKVTEFILNAGINPLMYMDYVPYRYLARTDIQKITIPSHIESVGESAFRNCVNLEEVSFEEGSILLSIEDAAFWRCESIKRLHIPKSVQRIGQNAFYYCKSLQEVHIPQNIEALRVDTFEDCASLMDIYFDGTVSKWYDIPKYAGWDRKTPKYTVHCIDGDIKKN